MHGRFTWYELYTSDSASAARFYPPITGWGLQRWDQASAGDPYEMWTAGGVPFSGMLPLSDEMKAMGAKPHWLAYIEVTSATETIAKAGAMSGKVVWGPETVPSVGVLAVMADPQGAVFAILQPETASNGFDGTPTLGKPSWHELLTTDYKAALNFYGALFGWTKLDEMDVGGGMKYVQFSAGTGKKPVGGMYNRGGPMANVPPNWMLYMNVRDARASVDAITRGGGKVLNGPMQPPGGDWVVVAMDPQGVAFAVHSTAAQAVVKPAKAKAKAAKAKPKSKAKKKDAKKDKKKNKKNKKDKKDKKKEKKQKKKDKKKRKKDKKKKR